MVHALTEEWAASLGAHLAQGDDLVLWLDGVGQILGAIDDLAGGDPAAGGAWTRLLDLDRADEAWLPWLGQFVGARPPDILTAAEKRQWIRDRRSWRRGTPEAIRAAVRPFLRSGDADLVERPGGEAYQLTVRVRDEQVGGRRLYQLAADYAGQTLADVDSDFTTLDDLEGDASLAEAAALAAVPAGIVASFEVAPDYTLSDLDDDFSGDTLADVDAAAATLMDLTFYTP